MSANRGPLERIERIAVVVLCVVLAGEVVYRHLAPPSSQPVSPTPPPVRQPIVEYKAGDIFEPVPGLALAVGRAALILVVRDGCIYCTQSVPFYQRLAETVRRDAARVDLIGVCPETSEACLDYFERSEVSVTWAAGISSAAALKVPGTPTLILVDETGKVEGAWVGRLSPVRENAVLEAVMSRVGN